MLQTGRIQKTDRSQTAAGFNSPNGIKKTKENHQVQINWLGRWIPPDDSLSSWGKQQPEVVAIQNQKSDVVFQEHPKRSPTIRLSSLDLLPSTLAEVQELLSGVRNYDVLMEDWGARETGAQPLRTAILSGPPGTGKSSLAEAIARELRLQLLELDLASLVSKYRGETAQRLSTVFAAAAAKDVCLFCDEAHTLLAKPTHGDQAGDRENQQVRDVLMKRLEKHPGLVLFAVNTKAGLDKAFFRRLLQHIEVPLPDEALRTKLWTRMVPQKAPGRQELDFAELGKESKGLAGGDIRNAVWKGMSAAVARARDERLLRQEDLLAATRSVLRMKGTFGAAEGEPHSQVRDSSSS